MANPAPTSNRASFQAAVASTGAKIIADRDLAAFLAKREAK